MPDLRHSQRFERAYRKQKTLLLKIKVIPIYAWLYWFIKAITEVITRTLQFKKLERTAYRNYCMTLTFK